MLHTYEKPEMGYRKMKLEWHLVTAVYLIIIHKTLRLLLFFVFVFVSIDAMWIKFKKQLL